MKRCHRRGGCPDQLPASKRIPPARLLTGNTRVGFVHRMNFLKEESENRMNRAAYGFHFLSFLVSHPVISAYTNISLEGRILLFQMTDSQPASRSVSLKQTIFFFLLCYQRSQFQGELISFLQGFADLCKK